MILVLLKSMKWRNNLVVRPSAPVASPSHGSARRHNPRLPQSRVHASAPSLDSSSPPSAPQSRVRASVPNPTPPLSRAPPLLHTSLIPRPPLCRALPLRLIFFSIRHPFLGSLLGTSHPISYPYARRFRALRTPPRDAPSTSPSTRHAWGEEDGVTPLRLRINDAAASGRCLFRRRLCLFESAPPPANAGSGGRNYWRGATTASSWWILRLVPPSAAFLAGHNPGPCLRVDAAASPPSLHCPHLRCSLQTPR
jgi:hypothetical protein